MGKRERERSCQAVYPCHNSQKSAMDEWITAISGCQGKSSVRFDVLMGAWWLSRNRIHKSSHVDANFSPTYFPSACKWIAFAVAEIFNLFSHRNAVYCGHTSTNKFPLRPCRQSFRAMAAGLLRVCVCVLFLAIC